MNAMAPDSKRLTAVKQMLAPHLFACMYALRIALSFSLALFIAFYLDLDKPHWAAMTVLIVSLPSPGASVVKFFARLAGTLIGAIVVTFMASHALGDPWLMSCGLILWLAVCAYGAACHTDMLTYVFALSGYTTAILGFALSLAPNSYMVYYITQARVSEIVLGMACPLLVSLLLPSGADREKIRELRQAAREEAIFLFRHIVLLRQSGTQLLSRFDALVQRIMEAEKLALYDAATLAGSDELRREADRSRMAHLLSQFLTLDSLYASLARNAAFPRKAMDDWLEATDAWLEKRLADTRYGKKAPETPEFLLHSEAGRQYAATFPEARDNCLRFFERGSVKSRGNGGTAATPYRDHAEALRNAVRTIVCMLTAVAFWLGSQWDIGYILAVLVGVSCTLGATYPRAGKLVYLVMAAALCAIAVSAVLQYVFYIRSNSLATLLIITMPFIFLSSFAKLGSMVSFMFWHVCGLGVFFLNAYENTPRYDFSSFANNALAAMFSVVLVAVFFTVIPQSGAGIKLRRMKAKISRMAETFKKHPTPANRAAVESVIYSAIRQTQQIEDGEAKDKFLRFSFAVLKKTLRLTAPAS